MRLPSWALTARSHALHWFPITRWLPLYEWRRMLLADIVAACILCMLAAPEAVAYASIAGVKPQNGLYTAFGAPLVYTLLGTSPQLVTGPTTIMSILTRGAMPEEWSGAPLVPESDLYVRVASLLAFVIGCMQLALSAVGASFMTQLLSPPVMIGFTSGSAFLIASTQFSTLLGIPKCVAPSGGSCTVIDALRNISKHTNDIDAMVPVAGVLSLIALLFFKFGLPKLLPKKLTIIANTGPLVLLIFWIPLMAAQKEKLVAVGIKPVEAIPAGIPPPELPFPPLSSDFASYDIGKLLVGAIPPAIIGYVESLTIASVLARQYGRYAIEPGQELTTLGICNLAVSFLSGYAVTGSFSRSAVNASSGAMSAVSSAAAGFLLMIVLLVLTPVLSFMPKVATAAIVLSVIVKLVEIPAAAAVWRTDKRDFFVLFAVFIVTATSTVANGLLAGIAGQLLLSITRGMSYPSHVRVYAWSVRDRFVKTVVTQNAVVAAANSVAVRPYGSVKNRVPGARALRSQLAAAVASEDVCAQLPSWTPTCNPFAMSKHVDAATPDAPTWVWHVLSNMAPSTPALPSFLTATAASSMSLMSVNVSGGAERYQPHDDADAALKVPLTTADGARRASFPSDALTTVQEGSSAADQVRVLVMQFGPDLQFASVSRLEAHLNEAMLCYQPAIIVVDVTSACTCDTAGIASLMEASKVVAPAYVIVCGANRHLMQMMVRHAWASHLACVPHATMDAAVRALGHDAAGTHDAVELGTDQDAVMLANAWTAGSTCFLQLGDMLAVETPYEALQLGQAAARDLAARMNRDGAEPAVGESSSAPAGKKTDLVLAVPTSQLTLAKSRTRAALEPYVTSSETVTTADGLPRHTDRLTSVQQGLLSAHDATVGRFQGYRWWQTMLLWPLELVLGIFRTLRRVARVIARTSPYFLPSDEIPGESAALFVESSHAMAATSANGAPVGDDATPLATAGTLTDARL